MLLKILLFTKLMLVERDIFLSHFLKLVLTTLYTISIYSHLECKADKQQK